MVILFKKNYFSYLLLSEQNVKNNFPLRLLAKCMYCIYQDVR